MQERSLYLEKLVSIRDFFSSSSSAKLKECGSFFAEHALVHADVRSANIAIITFALAKFFDKHYILEAKDWQENRAAVDAELSMAIRAFEAEDDAGFTAHIDSLIKRIDVFGESHGRFIIGAIAKARLKCGAEIYAHGASLGKAVELSGAEQRDLASYIGSTTMADKYRTLDIAKRLAIAHEALEGGSRSLVIDSSSLISFAEAGLSDVLSFLHKQARLSFMIPLDVRDEVITRPLHIRKFEWSALRIKRTLAEGTLQMFQNTMLVRETKEIMRIGNEIYKLKGKPLQLIHPGESACLAIFAIAKVGAFVCDEKTARMMLEAPFALRDAVAREYTEKVEIDEKHLHAFREKTRGIGVIRSTELVALANELGYFKSFGSDAHEAFHASIYALRTAGCSITQEELDEYQSAY